MTHLKFRLMRLIEVYFSANKRRWENALTLLQVPFNVNADQLVWNDNKKKGFRYGTTCLSFYFYSLFWRVCYRQERGLQSC
jgi:hypothetical protein